MLDLKDSPTSLYGDGKIPNELLTEVCDIRTVEVQDGIKVGYVILNKRLLQSAVPIVAIGGFLADLTTPERAWEGIQLAALNRPVLLLDMPGHGLSSPHNLKQSWDLTFRRRTDSQAKPLLQAVQKLIGKDKTIEFFGISHGAHLALKAAALEKTDRVRAIYGVDIPAVKRRPTLALNAGMLLNNTLGRKKYLRALMGSRHERDFEAFKSVINEARTVRARWPVRNNLILFMMNVFMSVNAGKDGLRTLKNIINTKSTVVYAMTSEKGTVSCPNAIENYIRSLPDTQKSRVVQEVMHGEDHNIGISYLMPRAAAWVKTKSS